MTAKKAGKMKKYIAAIAVLVVSAASLQAAKKEKQGNKEAPPVITSVMQLAEALQKRGITGSESTDGIMPKFMQLFGLRQFREISGHNFSVQIYDFKSASGFNAADGIFHLYDMLSDDEVYKSRPFIICVDYPNEETHRKIYDALKALIPDIKIAGEKEY
jgi:hypothetical protein